MLKKCCKNCELYSEEIHRVRARNGEGDTETKDVIIHECRWYPNGEVIGWDTSKQWCGQFRAKAWS